MTISKSILSRLFCRVPTFVWAGFVACFLFIEPANASLIDSFNLAPFVPLVLTTMMNIATSLYNYFVGNGTGIIYIFIYAFLTFYIFMYLFKMFLPQDWLSFLGFSGGGEILNGKATGWSIADNIMKPCVRAIIAIVLLLQIRPVYVTQWVVNPFLQFGSIYTHSILTTMTQSTPDVSSVPTCPASITDSKWLSESSCNFLIQPVYIISQKNNDMIEYGFKFLKSGLRSLMTIIPHGAGGFLDIITGILLISAFVSANLFMALLIIQAIFDFCLALIMYPFNVLAWVAKKSDKWFDIWPAFDQIVDALKKLVITMIACAFMLCINIAIVRALFNWSSSAFVVAAGGMASSNIPTNAGTGFGNHFMLWLSSILTFFIMQNIFELTRKRLDLYTSGTKHELYDKVTNDAKIYWGKAKAAPGIIKDIWGGAKKILKK